jgi:hypothetical protein
VPLGAVKMRCSLVSGGSGTLTGVMIIDDLSVARAPVANLLFGNFWVNPSFELGSNLDQTDGTVANWNRGGNTPTICQVITNNYASSNHSLALTDTTAGDFYGEWYSDVLLSLWPETGVFGNGGGRGVVETGVPRLIFRSVTATLPKISGADDTAPVGLDCEGHGGWTQAASASVSPRARCRASNSRPMTCRL